MSAFAAEEGESKVTVQRTCDSPLLKTADPWRVLKVSTSHSMSRSSVKLRPSHLCVCVCGGGGVGAGVSDMV